VYTNKTDWSIIDNLQPVIEIMYFCNIPKLSRTLFFGLVTIFFIFPSSLYAEDWIDRQFMPNAQIKYFKTSKAKEEVPAESIQFPLKVNKTEGEFLEVDGGWVEKSHVLPLDEAVAYYTDYIKTKNPFSSWAYTNRGITWFAQNESSKALDDFTWAIRFNSRNALAYHYKAVTWFSRTEYDTAGNYLDDAIKYYPHNSKSYYYRGAAEYERGSKYAPAYQNALTDLNKAIELDPKFADAFMKRADTWFALEKYDQALKDYNTMIGLSPKSHLAYYKRGLTWHQQEKPAKAISDFNTAIRLAPEFWPTYNSRAYAFSANGDYDKAIKEIDALIEKDPIDETLLLTRGYFHESHGKFDRALEDYQKVIRQRPAWPQGHNGVSWIRSTCSDPEYRDGKEALKYGEKACELTRWRDPEYLDTLAAAYAETGNFEQAIKYQKIVLQRVEKESKKKEFETRLKLYLEEKPYHREPAELASKTD
tara:strand:+ start:522 stop:1952 length:1431 start_codon:yes stop_codon:yes gene_type:complete